MAGYPSLHPSGFIEFPDNCSGPKLYRSQPSRSSYAPTLNDFMNKYVTAEYKDNDFIRMATNMKQIVRTWDKVPNDIKKEFIKLIKQSNKPESGVEHFGDVKTDSEAVEKMNEYIDEIKKKNHSFDNVKVVNNDNRMSIGIIVIVSIVSIVIGFLIACCG
jgi:hypothetical protein